MYFVFFIFMLIFVFIFMLLFFSNYVLYPLWNIVNLTIIIDLFSLLIYRIFYLHIDGFMIIEMMCPMLLGFVKSSLNINLVYSLKVLNYSLFMIILPSILKCLYYFILIIEYGLNSVFMSLFIGNYILGFLDSSFCNFIII